MRLGFHISIARGFSKVVEKAQKTECEIIQLFSRNPRGWRYHDLNLDEVAQFKAKLASSNISPCFLHLPYLPNLAAAKEELYTKSINALCEDLRRAESLRIPFLIVHAGNCDNDFYSSIFLLILLLIGILFIWMAHFFISFVDYLMFDYCHFRVYFLFIRITVIAQNLVDFEQLRLIVRLF